LHALISAQVAHGHLLPRSLDDLERHATRFVVGDVAGRIVACAELAPLSARVGEVRSLVVSDDYRRVGLAARIVGALQDRARRAGMETLCAFTHQARFFVRQNFSIVPHMWIPEKITRDCLTCPLFRNCKQFAMVLTLAAVSRYAPPREAVSAREVTAAVA
jgi:amino-acid N-acetyltransferase